MIVITALKEKVRKKAFIIVIVLGGLITLLFGTGNATVTMNGIPLTDYTMLLPVVMTAFHVISCAMAITLSLSTIPNEYERHTSHLVWIRGASQARYHGALAVSNVLASLISHAILFLWLIIYILANDHAGDLWLVLPAFLASGISVGMVSLLTSWLSVILPTMVAGIISTIVTLAGVAYPLMELLKGLAGGFAGKVLKVMLFLLPDLHSIQSAGSNILTHTAPDWHVLFKGLLYAYVFAVGILLCRRKEA